MVSPFQRGNSPAPFVLPPDYVSILDKVGVAVEGQLLILRFQVDPDLALDMKRVRQDDCADLEGLSLNLGKWVQAGKVAVDSGLAYIMGLF